MVKEFSDRLSNLAAQMTEELKRILTSRVARKEDLDAMEKRIIDGVTALIKGGKPLDLTEVVQAGNELSAETQALDTAVNQNQPPQKDQTQ